MDRLDVERRPASGIYPHVTAAIQGGYRVIEIWESEAGFNAFLAERLAPAAAAENIDRDMIVTIEPLHNFFTPRSSELADLALAAPGGGARRRASESG